MIRNQPAYSIRASDHESHAKAGCMAAINPVSQNSRKYLARRGRPCMDHSPSGRARPSQHWAALGACAARACRYKHMRSRTDCGRSRFMTRSDGYRRRGSPHLWPPAMAPHIPLGSRREISLCAKHPLKRPHLFRRLRNNFLAFLNG